MAVVITPIDCDVNNKIRVSELVASIKELQECCVGVDGRITVNEGNIEDIYNILAGMSHLRTRLDGSVLYMTDDGTAP